MSLRELLLVDVPHLKQFFYGHTEIIREFIASMTCSALARGFPSLSTQLFDFMCGLLGTPCFTSYRC
jgi:hypothetical protein